MQLVSRACGRTPGGPPWFAVRLTALRLVEAASVRVPHGESGREDVFSKSNVGGSPGWRQLPDAG